MDQSAIDELAQTFMRARKTGERLDALPAHLAPKNFAKSRAVMDGVDKLVGEPHRRHQDRRQARRRGGLCAAAGGTRFQTARPGCRAR